MGKKSIKIVFIFAIHLLLVSSVWAPKGAGQATGPGSHPVTGDFATLSGFFTRSFKVDNSSDSIRGNFYFLGSNKMHIEVNYPLHQIMIIESNITTIYYPDSREGVRLESANPVVLPLVPGLMMAVRSDYGLSDAGFKLDRQEMRGDTLVSFWLHAKQPDKVGVFRIAECNDRLVYSHFTAVKNQIENKTTFSNHVLRKGISLPTHIVSIGKSPNGNSHEKIILENLRVNEPISASVQHFRIPADARIENKKW